MSGAMPGPKAGPADRTRYESHAWGGDGGEECIACGATWQDCEGECPGVPVNLAVFLSARIAEDEAVARAATPGPWTNDGSVYAGHPTNEVVDYAYGDNGAHIARHDPARVLAECEARQRIIDLHTSEETPTICPVCHYHGAWEVLPELQPCLTLRALALPYADHEQYRPEWRT